MDTSVKKFALRGDLHWVSLTSANDLWYQGGGPFDDKVFGYVGRLSYGRARLGTVADISAGWKATKHLGSNVCNSHASGKDVMDVIYPQGHNALWGYVELDCHWKR